MPAFVLAHPWMTLILGLAALSTVAEVFGKPSATVVTPPSPAPALPPTTQTSGWLPALPPFPALPNMTPYGTGVYAGLVRR